MNYAEHLFVGMKVIESPLAVQVEPRRKHRRRRWQSEAYHERVAKKWRKRFGTKQVPGMYQMDGRIYGLPGPVLLIHPELMAKLKTQAVQPRR